MALFSKSLNPGKSQFLITTEDFSCIALYKWLVYMAECGQVMVWSRPEISSDSVSHHIVSRHVVTQ